MLFDFTEDECEAMRHALATYVSDLREEITKTEKHEWIEGLRRERDLLEHIIAQLSLK